MTSPEKIKILILVESIDVDDSSGSKANMALIKNLAKAGFYLKVYHYTRKEISIDGIECIRIPEKRKSLLFFLSRSERYLRYFTKIKLNKPLENAFGFSFTLKNDRNSMVSALTEEKKFNPDWVLTLSRGGSFRPHHALLKLPEWHKKWIAYIHDPYPMHWYPKPYTWHEPGFEQKEQFMKAVADKCAVTAFPSQLLLEWMGKHDANYARKGVVIPHQIDTTRSIKGRDDESILIDPEKFNLVHAGNLLQARKPHGLVEGFKLFLHRNPEAEAKLFQIGPGAHYANYFEEQLTTEPRIEFINANRPFREVQKIQLEASVNIILEADADFSPFLPGKFPHCIKANKPILLLGPEKSEARRLLGKDYPYWSEINDTNEIARHIEVLYINWKKGYCRLDRKDLENYLSANYLKEVIQDLSVS